MRISDWSSDVCSSDLRRQDEADILVSRISDEIGRLSVDIADVVGDVQQVSPLIDTQTDQFHAITQATREIADSNQSIADMAVETQRVDAPANQDVGKSHAELKQALTDIAELVDSVNAIREQLVIFETTMKKVARVQIGRANV